MPEGEWRRLHPASILILALQQGKALIAAIATIILTRTGERAERGMMIVEIVAAGIGLLAFVPAILRYIALKYRIADGVFTLHSGLMFRQTRTIPLERIQNVSLKRTLLQRLLGVSTVQIETASGTGVEAELTAVGAADARALVDELRNVTSQGKVDLEEPLYQATLGQLLMAGVTQNKVGVILLFVLGLFNYVQDIFMDRISDLAKLPERYGVSQMTMAGGMVVALVLLIGVGWVFSIVTVLVKYFGFTLRQESGLLKVRHGLFTQVQAILSSRRVQTISVVAPILQRKLGYCNVLASSAASFADKDTGGAAQLSPIIERSNANRLMRLVFPQLDFDSVQWRRVSRLTIRRSFLRYALGGMVLLGVADIVLGRAVFWLTPVVLVLAHLASNRHYRVLAYSWQGGFVFGRDGIWKRRFTIVPEDRIQWVGLTQGPIQKRLGLCSLSIVTAAAGAGHLNLEDLPIEEGLELQDRLIVRSEDLEQSLVGGV